MMNNTGSLPRQFSNRLTNIIFLLGIFAPIMMMASIMIVGQITPDYSPVSETISLMGAQEQPYSIVLNSSYIIYGSIIISIACNLYKGLYHSAMVKTLSILLFIHAVGSIFLAVFPDKPCTSGGYFSENIVHNTFSGISYVALLMGILVYSMSAVRGKTTKIIAIAGIAVVSINLAMPLINVVSYFKEIAGLLQRFFIFCSFSWVILTSILLYRRLLLSYPESSNDAKFLRPLLLPY